MIVCQNLRAFVITDLRSQAFVMEVVRLLLVSSKDAFFLYPKNQLCYEGFPLWTNQIDLNQFFAKGKEVTR